MNLLEYQNALNYCLTTYNRRDITYVLSKAFGSESKKPAFNAPPTEIEFEYENKAKLEEYEEKCAQEQEIEFEEWLKSIEVKRNS